MFAFCLECYVLFFLCCFLHFLSQAGLIFSVTFKVGLIFMGATTDKVSQGLCVLKFVNSSWRLKVIPLEEHNFSISPTFTRYTKLSFIFWFPENVTRIETRIKITSIITRKVLELFSLIHFLWWGEGVQNKLHSFLQEIILPTQSSDIVLSNIRWHYY